MAHIRLPRAWEIAERLATPEAVYMDRRRFLRGLAVAGLGAAAGATLSCGSDSSAGAADGSLYPARPNRDYAVGDRPLTDEQAAASFNNFYEFSLSKTQVRLVASSFEIQPWQVEIAGLVDKPGVYEVDDLVRRMPLEERVYRFRCVEAWSMVVPWTGFPFRALMDLVQPLSAARFVRLQTFFRPEQAPVQATQHWFPWPYMEGLTMAEARNELTLLATGIYGHEMPVQHGAPIRLIVPWKYGFKSIKSIVRIVFTAEQPSTFWNHLSPTEYGFEANVDPAVPHSRWSQAGERLIGSDELVPTLSYNGYTDQVADLYGG